MGHKFKDINIENHTYFFFNDMINIKNLDPNKVTIDKKLYKNILICCIGLLHVTVKDLRYVKLTV